MLSRILRHLVLILVSACALPLAAQETENRTALVIGCDYEGTGLHLPSPLQDAKAIAAKLESLGFTVIIRSNPDLEEFDKAADEFGTSLKTRKGVGLFYFSGHGSQVDEKNYLIPHKAKLSFREDLRTRAYAAQDVVTRMEAAGCRLNLLFLDACRTNELPSSTTKSLGKGLADMDAAAGMLISFASARNTEALDSGTGSVYTNALLTHIATPGLSVLDMLTKVNAAVKKETSGRQVPFMESGLDGTFAFALGGGAAQALTQAETEARVQAEVARRIAEQAKEKQLTPEQMRQIMQEEIRKAMKDQPKPAAAPATGLDRLAGKWRVVEKVVKTQGGWTIVWNYDCTVAGGAATFVGRKISVNGKKPGRGESQAVSTLSLRLDGFTATGSGDEVNHKGEHLKSAASLNFDASLESFSGPLSAGGETISQLTGSKQ